MPSGNDSAAATAIAQEAFSALERKDYGRVAELVRPEALDQFRASQLGMVAAWHDAQRHFKDWPTARANPALRHYPGISSFEELDALTPRVLFARWLEGHELKPENYDDGHPPADHRTVVGAVAERPDLVHVVYRIETDVGRFGDTVQTEVIGVYKTSEGWRVDLNRDLSHHVYVEITREGDFGGGDT